MLKKVSYLLNSIYIYLTIMSILIVKSKENLASAELLIETKYYNSSVHCSYYSCVQIMLNLLLNKLGYDPEKLRKEIQVSGNKGSHVFAINQIFNKIKEKENCHFIAVDFRREISLLKNKRDKADYQEIVIDEQFSKDALGQAKAINTVLNNQFI
jgi:uncharacterized protein (UPF0332 family)